MDEESRVIISGGGTGGHIFPVISITNVIEVEHPEAKILSVGADGRMETQRVPAIGYEMKGLSIRGFGRTNKLKNIEVPCKSWKNLRMARQTIKDFKPQIIVGVGGYASGATLYECTEMGIPCLVQEQNPYVGVTNKLLSKRVKKIYVAHEGMDRFFPVDKIVMTGNPVRQDVPSIPLPVGELRRSSGLDPNKKTILLVGGNLGARTVNHSVIGHLDLIKQSDVQFIWQMSRLCHQQVLGLMKGKELPNLKIMGFVSNMGAAYKVTDFVISRVGASSISESQLTGKLVILISSPNVAEDHQIKNATTLANKDAALCIEDVDIPDTLIKLALDTITSDEKLASLSESIKRVGLRNFAEIIAGEVIKFIKEQSYLPIGRV